MKRYLVLMLVLAVAGAAIIPAAAADGCPAPKVYLMPTKVNSDLITQEQGQALNDAFSIGLRNANPAVEILSAQDVGNVLGFAHDKILLGTDSGETQALTTIARSTSAEYIATLTIGTVGSRYVVQTTIIDADLFTVIARGSTETASMEGLIGAVNTQVEALGDLSALIETHETANPVPPRAPSLSVTVRPESVTAEDIRDTTTITVTVRNCKGDVVPGTKVYFESETARGRVTTDDGASKDAAYQGWQVATTGADGTARATYHLARSHGVGAGSDTVAIATVGRGHKEVRSKATIAITGVILEAYPNDAEIAPRGATDIYLSLFELNTDGTKRPLEGRSLYIETHRLSTGAKVSVVGPVDGDGNPVTAADGTAVLKFVAGEKEGLEKLRILFQDVGTGYQDAIEAWAEIVVKKDEYVATVDWKESGDLIYEYSFQDQYDLRDYQYTLSIDTTTQREKNTGQELTDGSFVYTDTLTLYSEGRTWEGSYTVPFEERWLIRSNVNGKITDHQSINTVVKERLSTLDIPLTPFPVAFDVSGTIQYAGSVLFKTGGSGQTAESGGQIPTTGAIQIPGRTPVTGIVAETLPRVSDDDLRYGIIRFLRIQADSVDDQMSAMTDQKVTGLLTKTGNNVYTRRWSVQESNSYHGELFTFYEYEARMDMDSSFTRDVTLRAVKQ
ncbi:hypothetical protein AZH53_01190 [Methanomicrobiaceae archaeon CYW5]|uniref:hypothetical protein n=1 Tax=Methanovulcanius yangii TaxID=1789227 RepID=UPI0029CA24DA|nr:hypothetical protein [Methanovulcanius yangii]MBT8507043.1 hypothetical protein [Methanovulcanius yangii]